MPTSQSARLRPRAASASGSESPPGPERVETLPNRLRRERRNPQPADRLRTPRRFIDVAENQFAFAPRVRCADDARDARGKQNLPYRLELVFGFFVNDQRPGFRQHRQQIAPPRLPLRPDFMRLGERSQMANGPRHHIAVTVQIALAPSPRPQDFRDITRHRGLLGQHRNCRRTQITSVVLEGYGGTAGRVGENSRGISLSGLRGRFLERKEALGWVVGVIYWS